MLRGIRILDLSALLPGPLATQLLADLGAEVIKVESLKGDGVRLYPPKAADGTSAMFHALNRGKASVALDLKTPAGREALLDTLLPTADVLVEGFRPGVLERLLRIESCDELLRRRPGLVVCRISGFGQGDLSPGHDINYCARAGVLGMMAEPAALPVQVADVAGGAYPAALQIAAALVRRDPAGAVLDVSLAAGAHAMLALALARAACSDERVDGGRDLLAGHAPAYRVYAAAAGSRVAVGALEPHFWEALLDALGLPVELAPLGLAGGAAGQRAIDAVQAALLERPAAEWEAFFAERDVPVNAVASPAEAARDPRLPTVHIAKLGGLALPATPIPGPVAEPGPQLGADNARLGVDV